MARLLITLDTNTIDHRDRIEVACAGLDVELAYTTVTDRETRGTSRETSGAGVTETMVWDESEWGNSVWGGSVPETIVFGESLFGQAAFGSDQSPQMMEQILSEIGNGSFPADRESLSAGEKRQLRDAMVLEAHARDRRDVLVTEDAKAFIRDGRRKRLEQLCRTRIMTVDEFCDGVARLAS